MILDEDSARERLESPSNLANRIAQIRRDRKSSSDKFVEIRQPGRRLPKLPEEVKQEIKKEALSGERTQNEIASDFGVTSARVSQLKREAETSSVDLSKNRTERDEQIRDFALNKMMTALGLITEEKMTKVKTRDLANIASSMSKIAGNLSPKQQQVPLVNLIIYSPEVKTEHDYNVVELSR